jgi:hypothetical protein
MRSRLVVAGLLLVGIVGGLLVWHPWNRPRVVVTGAVTQWIRLQQRYHVFPIMPSWFPPGTALVNYQPISAQTQDRDAEVSLVSAHSRHPWGIAIYEWRGTQTVIVGHHPRPVRVGGVELMTAHWFVPSSRAHVGFAWFRLHGVSIVVNGVNVPLTTLEQVASSLRTP